MYCLTYTSAILDQQPFPRSAGATRVFGAPARLRREHIDHFALAGQDVLDAGHDVVRLERLTVVFANVGVGGDARLRAQVAGELAALGVLHDDDAPAVAKYFADFLNVEGHQELDVQVVGGDAFAVEHLDRLG